jgi:hypothetical protein
MDAICDNYISFPFVLSYLLGYVVTFLGCTVYSHCVGVYVVSVPSYNVETFLQLRGGCMYYITVMTSRIRIPIRPVQ